MMSERNGDGMVIVKGPTKKVSSISTNIFQRCEVFACARLENDKKRYKSGGIKAKILQLNVSLLIEKKGSAVFEPRTSKLHVVDQCFSVR